MTPDYDGYVLAGSHEANAYDDTGARATVTLHHYWCLTCGASVTAIGRRGQREVDAAAVRRHDIWHEEVAG